MCLMEIFIYFKSRFFWAVGEVIKNVYIITVQQEAESFSTFPLENFCYTLTQLFHHSNLAKATQRTINGREPDSFFIMMKNRRDI